MTTPEPPNLAGWHAWCESCQTYRGVKCMKERDEESGEAWYEYVCSECLSIVLTIHRANQKEREKNLAETLKFVN